METRSLVDLDIKVAYMRMCEAIQTHVCECVNVLQGGNTTCVTLSTLGGNLEADRILYARTRTQHGNTWKWFTPNLLSFFLSLSLSFFVKIHEQPRILLHPVCVCINICVRVCVCVCLVRRVASIGNNPSPKGTPPEQSDAGHMLKQN